MLKQLKTIETEAFGGLGKQVPPATVLAFPVANKASAPAWLHKKPWPNPAFRAWVPPADYRSPPLYTPEQRVRRDNSPWTMVQAILAPLQFLVFLVSLGLVAHYLMTGNGYEAATISIVIKTIVLYVIMITGSIWEKVVFDEWLFAAPFFWEDAFSMIVLGLQTLYLFGLIFEIWSPNTLMMIALAAYGTYLINAAQFVWKLRVARLEAAKTAQDTPKGAMT